MTNYTLTEEVKMKEEKLLNAFFLNVYYEIKTVNQDAETACENIETLIDMTEDDLKKVTGIKKEKDD